MHDSPSFAVVFLVIANHFSIQPCPLCNEIHARIQGHYNGHDHSER